MKVSSKFLISIFLLGGAQCFAASYMPGEVLIKLAGSFPLNSVSGSRDPILNKYEIKSMTEISDKGLKVQNATQQPNIYKIEFANPTINVLDVVKEYSNREGVLIAQPNFIYQPMSIPNDQSY